MIILNKELNYLKYSFIPVDELEEYKANALNLTKDNIMKGYYESTLSLDVKENNYVDDFFLNSTDTIVDRIYFIDENKELYVKYLVYNDSQTDKIKVCMIKNLTEESVRLFEEKVLKDENTVELEEHKVIKLLNSLKEKVETLENYNDSEIKGIIGQIKEKIDTVENYNDNELKELIRALKSKLETLENYNDSEIRGYLTVITTKLENLASKQVEVNLTETNNKIDNAKTEILGAIGNINTNNTEISGEIGKKEIEALYKLLKTQSNTTIKINELATMTDIVSSEIDNVMLGGNRLTFEKIKRGTEQLFGDFENELTSMNIIKKTFEGGNAYVFNDVEGIVVIKLEEQNYGTAWKTIKKIDIFDNKRNFIVKRGESVTYVELKENNSFGNQSGYDDFALPIINFNENDNSSYSTTEKINKNKEYKINMNTEKIIYLFFGETKEEIIDKYFYFLSILALYNYNKMKEKLLEFLE